MTGAHGRPLKPRSCTGAALRAEITALCYPFLRFLVLGGASYAHPYRSMIHCIRQKADTGRIAGTLFSR